MSARVFQPISLMEMSQLRQSPTIERRSAYRGVVKVKRALFGPINHEEMHLFLEQELEKQRVSQSRKWEYDFAKGMPLDVPDGRYEWTKVHGSADQQKHQKRRSNEGCDISDLYPQPVERPDSIQENPENEAEEEEIMAVDKTPQKEANKKQSLITDFMQSRKRPETSIAKKLSAESVRPAKLAKVSARIHLAS